MGESKLLRGTMILTVAQIISKVLGFIYVVPFVYFVGTTGYILFEYAYKPYAIILSLATMGVPSAVSKFVSKYNELGDYEIGRRLYKSGIILMTITGIITFILLFFSADLISNLLINDKDMTGNSKQEVVFVIRMVSFALLVVPVMALIRGYFQGYNSMMPTAVSQMIEQLVRIIFILVSAFLIMKVFKGEVDTAVGLATFGAFIGAIAGLFVLIYYWKKRSSFFKEKLETSKTNSDISLVRIYKELIQYAIPFVLVGLAIPIYQTLDTFMINKALMSVHYSQLQAETTNSVVALVQKIILIPISLATAFAVTLIPTVTKSYVAKDFKSLENHISQTLDINMFLTLPATVGLMVLGHPAYYFLFGTSEAELGGQLMVWYAPMAIILSLFTVSSAIMQGLDKQKLAVGSLAIGLVVKGLLNFYFIKEFLSIGTAITTYIGLGISIIINLYYIKKYAEYNFGKIAGNMAKILLTSVIMAIAVLVLDKYIVIPLVRNLPSIYLKETIRLVVGILLGITAYFVVAWRLGLVERYLGNFINKMKNKLKR